MEIPYTKMHGLGNSYIYLNLYDIDLSEEELAPLAIKVADVNTGIGADGMILIHPTEEADVGMRIFNKDGSEGKNCGNGLRCVAKYAYENSLVHKETFTIETKAGFVTAEVHVQDGAVSTVTVDMGEPKLQRPEIPMVGEDVKVISEPFETSQGVYDVTAVSMGNPHAVFYVEDIEGAPLYELGPEITDDKRFPEGVNVEFVQVASTTELHFRVWERGSGVTQACGTGACAAAVSSVLNGYCNVGEPITVHLAGGDLIIKWDEENHVWMTGAAETVATGVYYWKQEN
ncbi:diaminopimelate epimerase [Pontibacillus halophilus JSM 076056 = DSM 19796]|uniref:Diaminopimelate epimerase n=1 Tax=Pontibacillus halophilus JSM 076056 = DSM 19796 TaxID=1385510 RepID=A0A0A5GC84_9BACI|nr:diaminopimelate epimerase [Pontibacillus halophilus]KGX89619.1 diaminopimelate epimerase [Pontibacillus halophilus JSM 076056 = DSM 19796]